MIPFLTLFAILQTPFTQDCKQVPRLAAYYRKMPDEKEIEKEVQARRKEIATIKKSWQPYIPPTPLLHDLLKEGTLIPAPKGCGSAYILHNKEGQPCYIIKPIDEDIHCLNNRKYYANPFIERSYRIRDEIPLYASAQREALCSAIANLLELTHLTPPATLAILETPAFFDLSERLDEEHPLHLSHPDKEKLCSVHPYLPHIQSLTSLIKEWLEKQLSEKQINEKIDQRSFEELFLFLWIIYDTDAHSENIYAQKNQSGTYSLFKLDNGLTFPEKNRGLANSLHFFPGAQKTPSKELQQQVATLPVQRMAKEIATFQLESTLPAFYKRIALLQELTQDSSLRLCDINDRLQAMHETCLSIPRNDERVFGNCFYQRKLRFFP